MENMKTSITTDNPVTVPKPKGKGGDKKVILCSVAGAIILLAAFFLIEKQTGLIGIFNDGDNSESIQELSDSEVEAEDEFWTWDMDDSGSGEEGDEESKFKNTADLAFSGLSDDQYVLAVAYLEEELIEREPDSTYFVLDNTSITYETAPFDSENALDGIENVEVLSEDGLTEMSSEGTGSDSPRSYSTILFDVISSSQKKYKVVIDTGGTISGFKEIRIIEQ